MKKKYRRHTEEFKAEAVQLARKVGVLTEAARQLGIHQNQLRKWVREAGTTPQEAVSGTPVPSVQGTLTPDELALRVPKRVPRSKVTPELERLRRENQKLLKVANAWRTLAQVSLED